MCVGAGAGRRGAGRCRAFRGAWDAWLGGLAGWWGRGERPRGTTWSLSYDSSGSSGGCQRVLRRVVGVRPVQYDEGATDAEQGERDVGAAIWLIVIGGVLVALGSLAYAGLWRSWMRRSTPSMPFGLFWLGLALACEGIAAFCFDGPVALALVLMVAFVLCGVLGMWLLFGGARWATPRWSRRAARR